MDDEDALLREAAKAAAGPPPVVFLHAAGAMPVMWQSQVEALGAERQAYAPWLAGFRPGRQHDGSIRRASEELVAMMDLNDIAAAQLVAHQLGAMVALQCAVDHLDRIDKMVLSGASVLPGRGALAMQRRMLKMLPAASLGPDVNKAALLRSLDAMSDADFSERLGEIDCPVLLICSDGDDTGCRNADALAVKLPNASVRLIRGSTTDPMFESPDEYNDALVAFLG
ncbi:MAG: alpha/beta hydrolase [Propionibacteriaceae bacterium]|jgi:pimeloyl-ACP methyl ester carboxylesterase|nr:alpha/beta hydrolase [Propionibacteriaceae bacterium]